MIDIDRFVFLKADNLDRAEDPRGHGQQRQRLAAAVPHHRPPAAAGPPLCHAVLQHEHSHARGGERKGHSTHVRRTIVL